MEQKRYPEKCGLLGKLSPGEKKLQGTTFYLDRVKKRSTTLLLEAITLFGGKVESFLHRDVSFVVTGSQEELAEQLESKAKTKTISEETQRSNQKEIVLSIDRQRQGTPRPVVCGSRGKALLEKAIRNNERLQGSSVLANARSWGVKILYADDVLLFLKQLSQESFDTKSKKSEKVYSKQSSHVVKAAALRSPYLKIEDSSRKYKPLHMQSICFPSLYYSGRYSPFECPPPRFDNWTEPEEKKNKEKSKLLKEVSVTIEAKSQTPLSCNHSPWQPRKKGLAYCECCHQTYNNQEEHLQSDQHRAFVLDASNYHAVDLLVAAMVPGFNPDPQPEELHNIPPTPTFIQNVCELEPLTDLETEDAVKDLRTQQSSFNGNILTLIEETVSPAPASPPPDLQQPTPNSVGTDMEIQLLIPEIDSQPCGLSPVMPVLEIMPQEQPLSDPEPDIKPLSPCPSHLCIYPDPLPPVLSPEVSDLQTHSSDLELPILSPQPLISNESKDEHLSEIDNQLSVFWFLPVDTLFNTTPVATADKTTSEINGAVCWKRRSRSLPRQATTACNSKKRCRSASPKCSLNKKRKITEMSVTGQNIDIKSEHAMTRDKYSLLFENAFGQTIQSSSKLVTPSPIYCTTDNLDSKPPSPTFNVPFVTQIDKAAQWPQKAPLKNSPLHCTRDKCHIGFSSQTSPCSNSNSTSVCIESALIPDITALSSSDSNWDCELLSHLGPPSGTPLTFTEPTCELDKELLHKPCTWMHDTSYESRLHNVLQPSMQTMSMDSTSFSRTVVQIVEVQH